MQNLQQTIGNVHCEMGRDNQRVQHYEKFLKKDLLWCQKIEFFPWPGVDFLPDLVYFPLCNGADVRPFWNVLSYQLVGVSYGSFLPCAIGVGKIHRYVQFLGYPFVFGELAAVVRCYGLHPLSFVRQEQPPHGFRHGPGLLPLFELLHEQEVRAPFRQRKDCVAVLVHYRVHFPVTEALAVRFRRTWCILTRLRMFVALVSCRREALRLYFILWRQWEASSPLSSLRMMA